MLKTTKVYLSTGKERQLLEAVPQVHIRGPSFACRKLAKNKNAQKKCNENKTGDRNAKRSAKVELRADEEHNTFPEKKQHSHAYIIL